MDEQLREIRDHLPETCYRRLPKNAAGHLAGTPCVYGLAWAYVAHTDSRLQLETLGRFILRVLCEKRGIDTPLSKPLHSSLGELLKALKEEGLVESQMAERILKASISILDAFNHVRNNQSLAHDNELLTYDEALLIFDNISSTIRFLTTLERRPKPVDPTPPSLDDDIPF